MQTVYSNYILFWICIIGLCLGSFYNVVILRSLSNESIIFPPSKCPKCGNRLKPWHNIPVLSYILLRGKCYYCREKISIQYPLIEVLTMVLLGFSFIKFGLDIKTLFVMFWVSCFIIMTTTDIKEKLVDCNIAIAVAVSGLIWNFINSGIVGLQDSFLGLILGAFVLEVIARSGYLFIKDRAMGEADTYVAGAIGAIFGVQNIMLVLAYGLVASMIFIVPQFLYNQFKSNNKVTCVLSILFILNCLIFKNLFENWLTLASLILLGILLSISILKSIKKEENRSYLPYVPALVAGALYFLFI